MLIKNAKVFAGRAFLDADIQFDRTVTAIGNIPGKADLDAAGCYVIPGLVDIHTHGAVGEDASDGKAEAFHRLSEYYAAHGVTSFLATTLARREKELTAAVSAVRDYRRQSGAKCAGIHLEGPFLSREKRGAHLEADLHKPDLALFDRLYEASGGQIRLVTVACGESGALELIAHAAQMCTVSLGHTAADYETSMTAYAAGASHATHLFNAMAPFHHRAPGLVGAAMDSGADAELICDGMHTHPAAVRAAWRMFGEHLILISDSIRCAGMPDGTYTLGGQSIAMRNGKAFVAGTDTLAGSSISLLDAVRNAVCFGLPLEAAVYAASAAPARAVGLDAGRIRQGAAADLVVLDRELQLVAVFVDGKRQR